MIDNIRNIKLDELQKLLEENPGKSVILKNLHSEKTKLKHRLASLKEPNKDYGNLDKILQRTKYKNYNDEYEKYVQKKEEINQKIEETDQKINSIEQDKDYDINRDKLMEIIPLIQKAKSIEEITMYINGDKKMTSNANKYVMAIFLLVQSCDIIKDDIDINEFYKALNKKKLYKNLEEIDFEKLFKSLKKAKLELDDGFVQFILMIMNEKSLCTKENLAKTFPILKQLKEDKGVPKNIRVGLEFLDSNKSKKKTIHEIGCEILVKEILYKIKENNVCLQTKNS